MMNVPAPTPDDRQRHASTTPLGHSHDTGPPCDFSLTPREALVMNLIQEGLSTRLAAKRLNVRPRTVDKHVERALRKLCARSRIEAVAILSTRLHAPGHRAGPAEKTPAVGLSE